MDTGQHEQHVLRIEIKTTYPIMQGRERISMAFENDNARQVDWRENKRRTNCGRVLVKVSIRILHVLWCERRKTNEESVVCMCVDERMHLLADYMRNR